jgi:hypothetical protein
MQKNLCNTNRLRVTVGRHLMGIVPHIRLREWAMFTRFFSDDHGRGRERNYSMSFGPFWLFVKWRPNGKTSSEDV